MIIPRLQNVNIIQRLQIQSDDWEKNEELCVVIGMWLRMLFLLVNASHEILSLQRIIDP
jgi:hypothetical protein